MTDIDSSVSLKVRLFFILKLLTEISWDFLFPNPQFRAEMDSPSGTYADFPKVTFLGTVQHSELVQTAMSHCFTLCIWKTYHWNYVPCPIYKILWNLVWTFLARYIANLPRSPIYDCILEEARTLIWRNHISWSIVNLKLKCLQKVQK